MSLHWFMKLKNRISHFHNQEGTGTHSGEYVTDVSILALLELRYHRRNWEGLVASLPRAALRWWVLMTLVIQNRTGVDRPTSD